MSGHLIPVLWLCGPPGVGKSTVAWEIYADLTRAGVPAGYVDIDQVGMCYPEPAGDPGRYVLKADNLAAMVASFRHSGARCVVVSGVADVASARLHADRTPDAEVTLCRLRVAPDELRERLARRGEHGPMVEEAVRNAEELDRNDVADVCVDTSGRSVAEVMRLVREQTGELFVPVAAPSVPERDAATASAPATGNGAPGPVLWVCGPTGVGKSSVGWLVSEAVRRAGVTTAFVDLEQIGFSWPVPADDPGNHRHKARSLAAVWQRFHASGARCLVVNGAVDRPADVRSYTDALPASTFTVCRLHAGPEQLRERVMLRGQGRSWAAPGDPLRGLPTARLHQVADNAIATAAALERFALGDLRVETDGRGVDEVAQAILAETGGWPGVNHLTGGAAQAGRGALERD
ncbi:AAA family ATPase [Actinopolymorpha pittospori]